jgi:hypothetical protein
LLPNSEGVTSTRTRFPIPGAEPAIAIEAQSKFERESKGKKV